MHPSILQETLDPAVASVFKRISPMRGNVCAQSMLPSTRTFPLVIGIQLDNQAILRELGFFVYCFTHRFSPLKFHVCLEFVTA
jgi:hypothetical protein